MGKYNQIYYQGHCEKDNTGTGVYKKNYELIAENIISTFQPKTVLVVGSSYEYLVQALREQGLSAYGIVGCINHINSKVLEGNIQSVAYDLPDEFPQKFDLVVSIEMLEQISQEFTENVISKLCTYGETIILSRYFDDEMENTEINVQQQEHWVRIFAKYGFYNKVGFKGNIVTSGDMLFIKESDISRVIAEYERIRRTAKKDTQNVVSKYEEQLKNLSEEVNKLNKVKEELLQKLETQKDDNVVIYKENTLLANKQKILGKALEKSISYVTEFNKLSNTIANLDYELHQNEEKILEFSSLKETKEEEIKKLHSDIAGYAFQVKEYDSLISYERNEMNKLEVEYNLIKNSTIWRSTKWVRVILDWSKKFVRLFFKVLKSLKNNGIKITLRKIKNNNTYQNMLHNIVSADNNDINELVSITYNRIDPLNCIYTQGKINRLNLVTDSIESHSLLGGVATALIVATQFCNYNDYELRIITRTTPCNPHNYTNILNCSGVSPAKKISFYSDYNVAQSKDYKMELMEGELFLATSWWSALAIKNTIPNKKFFYIIQEVETLFYVHGDEHFLCSQIMKDKNINYIINSSFLYEYFKENEPNIVNNGIYFEPAFPKSLYCTNNFTKKRKYKLFFYARPNNPRNLYKYGVIFLEKAISQGIIDTSEWDIFSAGQNTPKITFSNGYTVKNMGQLSWSEYSQFIKDIDLALSLMYTPHPSYPPYDVACSGGVVLTNKCCNKQSFDFCDNVIVADLSEELFMESFIEAVELAKNIDQRKINYMNSTISRDWNSSLETTIKYMKEKVSDNVQN